MGKQVRRYDKSWEEIDALIRSAADMVIEEALQAIVRHSDKKDRLDKHLATLERLQSFVSHARFMSNPQPTNNLNQDKAEKGNE